MGKRIFSILLIFVLLFAFGNCCQAADLNVNLKLDMKAKGNIFFEGDVAQVEAKVYNNDFAPHNITLQLEAKGRKYGEQWNKTISTELLAGASGKVDFTIDFSREFTKFDIYDLKIKALEGEAFKEFEFEFSYIKRGKRNPHFGVNTHFLMPDYKNTVDFAIDVLQKSGIGNVRDSVNWSKYEETEGVYAFPELFKDIPQKLKEADIELLYTLLYNNPLYTENSIKELPLTKGEIDAFAAYAEHVVTELGDNCTAYELWNESNSNSVYGGDLYADVAAAVYPVLTKANPKARLIGVSLNGRPTHNGYYLSDALKNGGASYMDAVSWHPYAEFGTLQNLKGRDIPESFLPQWFSDIKEIMAEDGEKFLDGMWITEQGWNVYFGNTEDEVAANLVRSYVLEMEQGAEKAFWYELIDSSVTYPLGFDAPTLKEGMEGMWGMLNGISEEKPLTAKPPLIAVSALNSALGDKRFESGSTENGIYNYVFSNDKDEKAFVLWTEGEEKTAEVDFGFSQLVRTDMYGNEEIISSENGIYTVNVSSEPAYYQSGEVPKFDYEYDSDTGLCKIKGYIDSELSGQMINFVVYKPDKGAYNVLNGDKTAIAYFDQIVTKDSGVFEYTFKPDTKEDGYCIIQLVAEDGEEGTYLLRLMDGISAKAELKDVSLDEITAGMTVKCDVIVESDIALTKNYDVYLGLFKGEKLVEIYRKADGLSDEWSQTTSFEITAPADFDNIKAFVWEGMSPVTKKYVID